MLTLLKFRYLSNGDLEAHGIDDGIAFDRMMDAFEHLEVPQEEINELFQIVGAVLHLGNIEFIGGDSVRPNLTSSYLCFRYPLPTPKSWLLFVNSYKLTQLLWRTLWYALLLTFI